MDLAQARRHAVLCEFIRPYQSHEDVGGFDAGAMADRIVRLEHILAALPNPIARKMLERDGIDEASDEQWREAVDDANRAIRAAVIAAEREVGRDL